MPRSEFSKKTKLAAWERSGGYCECGCNQKIIGTPEYDHIIEDMIDGGNDLENCRVMTKKCHRLKTEERRPELDKTRRSFEKRIGVRKRKGRPMPGTRTSGWKQKMDGSWERR
ncbi:MAG: HNH endonuclease signature motif containing protein [Filomicrobium sp.]